MGSRMIKNLKMGVIALTLTFISNISYASDIVEGLWLIENKRAVIEIEECDKGICGNIYWLTHDARKFDSSNPDESLRNQPLCGLRILWGFDKIREGKWANGRIYKADEGDIYRALVHSIDEDTLKVRGFVGVPMFGETQIWSRVTDFNYDRCEK